MQSLKNPAALAAFAAAALATASAHAGKVPDDFERHFASLTKRTILAACAMEAVSSNMPKGAELVTIPEPEAFGFGVRIVGRKAATYHNKKAGTAATRYDGVFIKVGMESTTLGAEVNFTENGPHSPRYVKRHNTYANGDMSFDGVKAYYGPKAKQSIIDGAERNIESLMRTYNACVAAYGVK